MSCRHVDVCGVSTIVDSTCTAVPPFAIRARVSRQCRTRQTAKAGVSSRARARQFPPKLCILIVERIIERIAPCTALVVNFMASPLDAGGARESRGASSEDAPAIPRHMSGQGTGLTPWPTQRAEDSGCCWGGMMKSLAGDVVLDRPPCEPGFVPGRKHLKNRFCVRCREGFSVPAICVRAATPALAQEVRKPHSSRAHARGLSIHTGGFRGRRSLPTVSKVSFGRSSAVLAIGSATSLHRARACLSSSSGAQCLRATGCRCPRRISVALPWSSMWPMGPWCRHR